MRSLRLLRVVCLISHPALLIVVRSDVNCQKFKFVIDEDVVYSHILEGHVFKRLTVYSAAQCHMMCKDYCLCVSMNYFPASKVNNCELNDVNKEMEPKALKWKQGVNYYDLVRSYTAKVSSKLFIILFVRSFVRLFLCLVCRFCLFCFVCLMIQYS